MARMDAAAARSRGHRQDRPLHVRARPTGRRARAGGKTRPLIAWTTEGEWHLHLSEWRFPGRKNPPPPSPKHATARQIQVNPLDQGRQDRAVSRHSTTRSSGRSVSTGRWLQVSEGGLPPVWRLRPGGQKRLGRPSFLPGAPPSTRAGSRARSTSAPGSRTCSPSGAGSATSPSSRPTTIRLASTSPSTGRVTGSES